MKTERDKKRNKTHGQTMDKVSYKADIKWPKKGRKI